MVCDRIEVNPRIMQGKPVIKGTRVTLEILLRKLAQNLSPAEILSDYPQLNEADIKAAVEYAPALLQYEEIIPFRTDKS